MDDQDTEQNGGRTRRGTLGMVVGVGLAAGTIGTGRILADEGSRSARTSSSTTQEDTRTFEWKGKRGGEHATQDCLDSEGFWHWVLTPGGQPSLNDGATLTVRFDDDSEATVEGYRNGNGDGAVHFDVTKSGGGTATWAQVEFSGGGKKPHLTISDGKCQEGETPEDTPTETPTTTPEDTATPTPEDTATPTPEDTATPTPEDTAETQEFDNLGVSLECVNGDGTLTVTNSNDEAVTVTVTGPDGYSETEEVPAGGSLEFPGLQNGTYNLASHHDDIGLEETTVDVDF